MTSAEDSARDRNDEHLDRDLSRAVRHSRRYVWAIMAVLGALVLAQSGAIAYLLIRSSAYSAEISRRVTDSQRQQDEQITRLQAAQNRRWCTSLELMTAEPVTPAAGPVSYRLYLSRLQLERDFGCPP